MKTYTVKQALRVNYAVKAAGDDLAAKLYGEGLPQLPAATLQIIAAFTELTCKQISTSPANCPIDFFWAMVENHLEAFKAHTSQQEIATAYIDRALKIVQDRLGEQAPNALQQYL